MIRFYLLLTKEATDHISILLSQWNPIFMFLNVGRWAHGSGTRLTESITKLYMISFAYFDREVNIPPFVYLIWSLLKKVSSHHAILHVFLKDKQVLTPFESHQQLAPEDVFVDSDFFQVTWIPSFGYGVVSRYRFLLEDFSFSRIIYKIFRIFKYIFES